MLAEGDLVPDVTLTGMDGQPVSLSAFRGNKLVLYFYPKDDTSGCTREAKDFSALAGEFEKAGTWILGVSKDDSKSHAKFAGKYDLKVKLARTSTAASARRSAPGARRASTAANIWASTAPPS